MNCTYVRKLRKILIFILNSFSKISCSRFHISQNENIFRIYSFFKQFQKEFKQNRLFWTDGVVSEFVRKYFSIPPKFSTPLPSKRLDRQYIFLPAHKISFLKTLAFFCLLNSILSSRVNSFLKKKKKKTQA